MRRAEFTKLTGLTPEFFNSLARRDQLPFLTRLAEGRRGWGSYSTRDAYMTILALALADAGATQFEAGHFIDAEFEQLFDGGLDVGSAAAADHYLGYMRVGETEFDPESNRQSTTTAKVPVWGSIEEVAERVLVRQIQTDVLPVLSIVLVNASQHLRELQRRASDLGLGLGDMANPSPLGGQIND